MERHREQTHRHGPGFSQDKYDFKVQKDERTFAQNLLHAGALDFVLIRRISKSNLGPDFGEGDNPSRDVFKTKADVVKFVQEAVADGARVIQHESNRRKLCRDYREDCSGDAETVRLISSILSGRNVGGRIVPEPCPRAGSARDGRAKEHPPASKSSLLYRPPGREAIVCRNAYPATKLAILWIPVL
jgi:hypothetical protein